MARFDNPLFWAVLIAWIMSVVLHEFAHGLVAYLGGDYTIRERGGLTLNPLQYVDPMMSLAIPALILAVGGVPLPGGATYVNRDLLRSRAWSSAVSLAGPAMNVLLFLICALPLHPRFGWVDVWAGSAGASPFQRLLATMAILQLLSVFLNLVPIPPLDGFGAISPYLNRDLRIKLTTPPLAPILFWGFILLIWQVPQVYELFYSGVKAVLDLLGYDARSQYFFGQSFNSTLFGSAG